LKSIGTRPTWGELVAAVEELRGLAWKQMRGKRGDWGRDLVWYVGRKLGGMSLKTLGEQAGGSDYATVSAAVKRMERRLQKDSALSDKVRGLRNRYFKFET
jgi:chromosomal replication initiation ATPase DnaA